MQNPPLGLVSPFFKKTTSVLNCTSHKCTSECVSESVYSHVSSTQVTEQHYQLFRSFTRATPPEGNLSPNF